MELIYYIISPKSVFQG